MTVAQKLQPCANGVVLDRKDVTEMYFPWNNSYTGKIAGNNNDQFCLPRLEAAEPRQLLIYAAISYKQSEENLIYTISCGRLQNIIHLVMLSNPNIIVERFSQTSFLVLLCMLQDTVFWYYFDMWLHDFGIHQDVIPW